MDLRAMECAATESVWLRLVRGDALEPVRMLPSDLADGAVSVGTAESCDWRIAAAEVPPVALHLMVIAGRLFVRAAGPSALRVDGHAVGSMWVPVERGARLAFGAALIEVGLAGRSRRAQHALLQRVFDQPLQRAPELAPLDGWSAHPDAASAALEAGPGLACADARENAPAPAVAWREDASAPLAGDPAIDPAREPSDGQEPHARGGAVGDAYESPWSATIFGAEYPLLWGSDEDAPNGAAYIRGWGSTSLLIAGSLLACAYGCWVLLLDYF